MKVITPFRIVFLFTAIALLSLSAVQHLTIGSGPSLSETTFTIGYSWTNNSPEVVEQEVTSVLENRLSEIPGIKGIRSTSGKSGGSVQLTFDNDEDLAMKQFEIAAVIRQVYPKLPPGVTYPVVVPATEGIGENKSPLLIYTIYASQPPIKIKQLTEEMIVQKLAENGMLQGAHLSGANPLQLVIRFNSNNCRALKVAPGQIIAALQAVYSESFPGFINNQSGDQYLLHIPAPETNIEKIEQTIIALPGGRIFLKDVARVSIEEKEAMSYFRINGKNAINLSLLVRPEAHSVSAAKELRAAVDRLRQQLPANYQLNLVYDDTWFLQKQMKKNYTSVWLSIGMLVLLILFTYRNFRYVMVFLLSLLVASALTILLVYLCQVRIQLYTIAGVTVLFGMMVNNSIVMLDYYRQFHHPKAILPLLAATAVTMGALCLVFLLPAEDKRELYDFACTAMLALSASFFTSLLFTPAIYQLLPVAGSSLTGNRNQFFLRKKYFHIISYPENHRRMYIIAIVVIFGSSLYFFMTGVTEKKVAEKVPEKTRLSVSAQLPAGSTLEQMNDIFAALEKSLAVMPGIDRFITNIYSGQAANMDISFKNGYENTALPYQLKGRLITRVASIGGVQWSIRGAGEGFSNAPEYELPGFRLTIKGYHYANLTKFFNGLTGTLAKNKRIQHLEGGGPNAIGTQYPKYVLQLNQHRMSLLGTNQYEIINTLSLLTKPTSDLMTLRIDKDYYPVSLKEENSDQYSITDLLHTPLVLDNGKALRVKDIGSFAWQYEPASIIRENRQYVRTVSFDFIGPQESGELYVKHLMAEMSQQMPDGYSVSTDKSENGGTQPVRSYGLLALFILLIFAISSMLFENVKQALCVIMMVLLSFSGLFITYIISGDCFDKGGYAAFLLVGSMVAGACMYIINDLNALCKQTTQSYNYLLIQAFFNRSPTILRMSLSTCCSLVPFLIQGRGAMFWFSFAAGTTGGLVYSLLLLFFVFPVLLHRRTNTTCYN